MKSLAGKMGVVGAAAVAPRPQRPLPQSEVAVVGLNSGFLRTEGVLQHMTSDALEKRFRADRSETVESIGRAAAELAREYGFTDLVGRLIPVFNPQAPRQVFPC